MRITWKWLIGVLVLLAICDDDDDGANRHCYEFGNGRTLCFPDALPKDKFCYAGPDDFVRCYDKPL